MQSTPGGLRLRPEDCASLSNTVRAQLKTKTKVSKAKLLLPKWIILLQPYIKGDGWQGDLNWITSTHRKVRLSSAPVIQALGRPSQEDLKDALAS